MNATAWPPFAPTLRVVTAGFAVAVDRVRVERRERGRAAQRVEVGRAVELHRLADDAGARARGGVHQQVAVGERAAGVA